MPTFKKGMKKIYAVKFNKEEQKALDDEIHRQIVERSEEYADHMDAIILWMLHTIFGFGKKRMERFYKNFKSESQLLLDNYEFDKSELSWLCSKKLKDYGVDLKQWKSELEDKHEEK